MIAILVRFPLLISDGVFPMESVCCPGVACTACLLLQLEAALALGASQSEASLPLIKKAVQVGLGPSLDYTRTVGLVQLPGQLTGMIMGGVSPQEAVNLQIVLTMSFLGSLSLSTVVAALLSAPQFFSRSGQLRDMQ